MPDSIKDEFHGQGGSYIVGTDGKRTLVERTESPNQEQALPVKKVSETPSEQQGE